ncbi:EamA family transporter, partial [Romboutsia ilealis]|nr:EamA family transporter [Romboutsia ilealis]
VTIVTSVLILHEQLTGMAAAGAVLTLLGLIISEGKIELKVLFTTRKQDAILKREKEN